MSTITAPYAGPANEFAGGGRTRTARRVDHLTLAERAVMGKAARAEPSVLEPFLGKSEFSNHGQRVVEGHRLMQAA